MVAISLYRGNLHRVPDVPRRWLMPTPKISLKDFKVLLHRRSTALSRLISTTTTSNPNPNLRQLEGTKGNEFPNNEPQPPRSDPPRVKNLEEGPSKSDSSFEEEVKDRRGSDGGGGSAKPVDGSDARCVIPENSSNPVDSRADSRGEKPVVPENTDTEQTSKKMDSLTDKEKRKREVEEKLQNLKAKKHNLVQVLKQILNAEEELKRRSSIQFQGMVTRPSVSLQVDATNYSGSMSRHATPRMMGSEGNLGSDMEGGEADDVSNHNVHSRNLLRMSSTSPSSDSPHRRPAYIQHNTVPHPSRANANVAVAVAVACSPSRFAPSGHQGHPANLPTVSVSGTNYIASSPSPAASSGTSAFRDCRLPSPWN